jgi:N-acetylglutamate synthase-like GNAT family acetyltransferase
MNEARKAFGRFLRAQRDRLGLKPQSIEEQVHVGIGGLYHFEQGNRCPNSEIASRLKEVLCHNEDLEAEKELKAEFDQLYRRARETRSRPTLFSLPIDSPDAELRMIPVPYPPFSGRENCFVDWLVKRMVELAGARFQIPDHFRADIDHGIFDLARRIAAVKSEEADVLVNLASLERARALTFLVTPIRVSVNGVMLRQPPNMLPPNLLREARSLLAQGPSQTHIPFKILAIPNEVGWVHVTRTLKVAETDIKAQRSLSNKKLADALTSYARKNPVPHILVCDELTALGVLAELNGDGVMVFQSSTDESITQSEKRRSLPAHPLGIGISRENQRLYSYLREAMTIFLSFENETVAAAYEELYWNLVEHTAKCLACDESVYFGGVRRLPLQGLSEGFRNTVLAQNARSYARRCLQLSRRALKALPGEMEPWTRVLQRARERIQVAEARNRGRVKAVLMSALKTVVGLDPAEDSSALNLEHFKEAVHSQWTKLKYILERDLDIEIPDNMRQEIFENSLEAFVSRIQRMLDGATDRANVSAVATQQEVSESQFAELLDQYRRESPNPVAIEGFEVLVATNLGEAIGFIALRQTSSRPGPASLEIIALFVADHMRHGSVGSRLVRKAVEHADKTSGIESVWLASPVPNEAKSLFLKCGFRNEGNRLLYQIDRLTEKRSAAAASTSDPRVRRRS